MTNTDVFRPVELSRVPPLQEVEADPSELNNPSAGNPDAAPGKDRPDQRPITDNKAGG